MIPKIIHYCWFGHNPKSELILRCIESWKKFCPDYEIKEWNESNYDINKIPYISQAYREKKYAFVSDYARFDILYRYGGVYFDTDVEVIKSLDKILEKPFAGVEHPGALNAGLGLASPAANPIYREILDDYEKRQFLKSDGTQDLTTVVEIVSNIFRKYGLTEKSEIQNISGIMVYPAEYFSPKDFKTHRLNITENTYTIHWYDASWFDDVMKTVWDYRRKVSQKIKNRKVIDFLVHLYSLKQRFKFYGPKETIKYYMKLLKRRIQQ